MDIQTDNQKEQAISNGNPEPIVGNRGASILGPRNVPIERQNPDALIAPATDAGTVPNLKWPFALSHNRVLSGGFARETTTRELPISTEIAGVNMHLKPGGIHELPWHKESEWAYVIKGSCRVSLFDEEGRLFIDDVSAGDLWYFPSGLPHSSSSRHGPLRRKYRRRATCVPRLIPLRSLRGHLPGPMDGCAAARVG
jgi:oxalate decarboxylase